MNRPLATSGVLLASGAALVACGLVFDVDALGPRASDASSPSDDGTDHPDPAPTSPDADDATTLTDAGPFDAATSDGRGPTGLDERVALPDLAAAPCTGPSRTFNSCARPSACRFATPDSGRCEDCTPPRCQGRIGSACVLSSDCELIYTCFRGYCTSTCELGGYECGGPPETCLRFGYEADSLGLCDPRTLP
jgi:hypothetical protein